MKVSPWVIAATLLSGCSGDGGPSGPSASTGSLSFLGSVPPSGSRLTAEGCGGTCTESLRIDFSAVLTTSVAHAELLVDLFDGAGKRCATGSVTGIALTAGRASSLSVHSLSLDAACASPMKLTSLKAKLRDDESWQVFLEREFPVDYTLEPVVSTSLVPDVIRLTWSDNATAGASPPRAKGSATIECEIDEKEGIGLTATVTLENGAGGWLWINEDDGSKPTTVTSPCAPQREPHLFNIGFRAGDPTLAVVTCSGVDWRGRASKPRSITIPVCCR